jgi:hypothetical protein
MVITLCDEVCQWLAAGRWFSPGSSTNKTDRNDITEILLKVVLNTITLIRTLTDGNLIEMEANKLELQWGT